MTKRLLLPSINTWCY